MSWIVSIGRNHCNVPNMSHCVLRDPCQPMPIWVFFSHKWCSDLKNKLNKLQCKCDSRNLLVKKSKEASPPFCWPVSPFEKYLVALSQMLMRCTKMGMVLEIYLSNCITGPIHVGTFDIFWDIFVKLYQWTHPHGHLWDAHYTTSNLIINLPPLQTCHCVKLREILKSCKYLSLILYESDIVRVWYCMSLILCESDIVWVWYCVSLIL